MGDQSPSVSVCFFVFYLLIIFLHLAQVETKPQPKCPKEFLCSNRSIPTFPFTNQSLPHCGLFKLGCNVVSSPPTLELDGKLYNTIAFGEEALVVLYDPVLRDHLKNRSCDSFNWNSSTSFTNSPSISFEMPKSQFLFLFKCNKGSSHHSRQKIDDYFKGYKSYRKCKNVTLYYKENHHIIPKNKVPKDCSLVQLPFDNSTKSNDLFEELTPDIIFFWKVSEKCSECHDRGGQCQTTSNNNFKCSGEGSHFPALLGFPLCLVCITSTDVIVSRRLVVTSLDLRATITAKLNFVVYYREDGNDTAPGGGNLPAECSVVQLPFRKNSRASDLFRKLNSLISVEWETRFVEPGEFKSKYSIVIGGDNFGCGSSREHAPVALGAAGVSAVVAESYARIFFRNSVSTGEIYPLESEVRICEECKTGDVVTVELGENKLINHTTGKEYKLKPIGDAGPVVEAGGIFAYARKTGMIPSRQA
nr:3-isopropylmalate dehydratase small subunit 3-like [Ipomoea batatas]